MNQGFDINSLLAGEFLIIIKGFYLLGLFMYVIFAALVIKQVRMMTRSLAGLLDLPVMPIALGHFLFALFLFLISAVIL